MIYHASKPPTAVLGHVKDEESFRSIYRRSDLETYDGLLIYRFDAGLFYANANYFVSNLQELINEASEPVHGVLIDASTINILDFTAIEKLHELEASLQKQGIKIYFAHVRDHLKDKMIQAGLVEKVGEEFFFETLTEGVSTFQNNMKENDHA